MIDRDSIALARTALLIAATFVAAHVQAQAPRPPVRAGDWPQWRGPDRTGLSRETGLLKVWPPEGPRLVWRSPGRGGGYSTPSVAAGRIYGMGYRGPEEVVWALDEATGREVWATPIGPPAVGVGYNDGPRGTPTVDGDRLYAIGVGGTLVCLDAATGQLRWSRSLTRDFGGIRPNWGYSESPLVDGDRLIVTPGGPTATMVALNRLTGEVIWVGVTPQRDRAQYASAIVAEVDGLRHYVQFVSGGVIGMAASDGRFLWRYDGPANGTANISTPIFWRNHVFAASAYQRGGGLVRLARTPTGIEATEVYFTRQMQNHHGGMVVVNDHLYGCDNQTLTCLELATGAVKWANRSVGKGSVAYADGHLIVRSERGPVALVEARPDSYVEKGRFFQPERSARDAWPHPVIANGKLYLRDQDVLLCYDLKGQ